MNNLKESKVLIIGGGVVGASTAIFLDYFGVNNISISTELEDKKSYQSLFQVDTITNFLGLGGLGNFWHGVINTNSIPRNDFSYKNILTVFELVMGFSPKPEDLNKEIIPLTTLRPKKLLDKLSNNTKILPKSISLKESSSQVKVNFSNGTFEYFDKVFVCSGSINNNDVLVNSGLAKTNNRVSDQVIFYENKVLRVSDKISDKLKTKKRLGYIAREYDLIDHIKVTYRPVYGRNKSHIKNKSIYSNSPLRVVLSLMNPVNFVHIFESLYLRYGIQFPTKRCRRFFQVDIKDCYYWDDGNLKVDHFKIQKLLKKLHKSNITINESDIVSGIHYYNTLIDVSSIVGQYNSNENKKIYHISSSSLSEVGPEHFTFRLIYNSFLLIKNLYKKEVA